MLVVDIPAYKKAQLIRKLMASFKEYSWPNYHFALLAAGILSKDHMVIKEGALCERFAQYEGIFADVQLGEDIKGQILNAFQRGELGSKDDIRQALVQMEEHDFIDIG